MAYTDDALMCLTTWTAQADLSADCQSSIAVKEDTTAEKKLSAKEKGAYHVSARRDRTRHHAVCNYLSPSHHYSQSKNKSEKREGRAALRK